MKILISVDIEGVAGVFHTQQTRAGNPEYERARRLMTEEANAAIAGAFDGGATEVWVNDSHGDFRNMPPDLLDERAQVIQGKPRYLSMAAGVELGLAGVCMVGYHARAGGHGILAHTINSFAFAHIDIGGEPVGEAALYGALAGEYGVPVLMASGDDAFVAETKPLFPHAVFVQTKRATGQTSGISLSPAQSRAAIREGVAAGLAAQAQARPLVWPRPLAVTLHTQTPALADLFCQWPAFERIEATALRFDAPSTEAAVRMLNCCSAMSALLR
ncbi:M55 family metallopeptidase [Variovorax sp. KK3]|uniref:M55 family metallopeptidase n=1 Tax=Variovorax sp. KK3 TaxID=1855728 RepID=UPI00097C5BDA|nr:M55 family metallopeptidase [Variovorax sp. KK3]